MQINPGCYYRILCSVDFSSADYQELKDEEYNKVSITSMVCLNIK